MVDSDIEQLVYAEGNIMVEIAFIETDNPEDWIIIEADDPALAMSDYFKGESFPENTRIYDAITFSHSNDITPHSIAGLNALRSHEGPLYVKSYPGELITIIAIVAGIIAAVSVTLLVSLPTPATRNTQSESPNNSLSSRSNRPRPNARIPDIYGTVRSTPDLLSTYSVFENHIEIEYSYMCVGRGEYFIEGDNVFDGDTPIVEIDGATVVVYRPFTSPVSGDVPQLLIGGTISEDVYIVHKSNAVNGQTLLAANDANIKGQSNISATSQGFVTTEDSTHIFSNEFSVGDSVQVNNGYYSEGGSVSQVETSIEVRFFTNGNIEAITPADFAGYSVGDQIAISNAIFVTFISGTGGGGVFDNRKPGDTFFDEFEDFTRQINLNGTYEIQAINGGVITLVNPNSINSNWSQIVGSTIYKIVNFSSAVIGSSVDLSGVYEVSSVTSSTIDFVNPENVKSDWIDVSSFLFGLTGGYSPVISRSNITWEGPFFIDEPISLVVASFTANQGLFKDDGEDQQSTTVQVELEVTPIDENGNSNGAVITRTGTVIGSKDSRSLRALTMRVVLSSETRVSVRARRITNLDLNFEGSVVDEIKFKTLYGMRQPTETDFGNITTVHSKTIATEGALAVKDRKLNMIVTRKVPLRVTGNIFTDPEPTTYAADIAVAICLDPEIGGLDIEEVDLDTIYNSVGEVRDYFGSTDYVSFSYTFDNDNLSLQESLQVIAKAVSCQEYRQADKIRFTPNIATDDSRILFNHRNKVPLSEERSDRFGVLDDVDGLEVEWIDPSDDSLTTFYIPEDRSATKPRKVETIGIRNDNQVFAFAWRTWLRLKYENGGTEFQATQEAELLVPTNRVLIADNTRNLVQDGEIISQAGLVLYTSQELTFINGSEYWVHLQHIDGTTEAIKVTPGPTSNSMTLSQAPRLPLSLEEENFARATYLLTDDATGRQSAFQISEVRGQGSSISVSATKYSGVYYINDALLYWLREGLKDYGPKGLTSIPSGVVEIQDADRETVLSSPVGSSLSAPIFAINESFSIGVWVKSISGTGRILGTATEQASLRIDGSGNISFKSGASVLTGGSIPSGDWVHVIASYDSQIGEMSIYVNGDLSVSGLLVMQGVALPYFIGDNASDGHYDDVRYYARSLSVEDAGSLYNLTRRV